MVRPRDLDDALRLTARRTWALLLAVALVLGAGVAWSVTARVESTVTLDGVLLAGREGGGAPLAALLLVDAAAPVVVPVGAAVRGGGLTGTVAATDPGPVPARDLATRYGLPGLPGDPGRLVRSVSVHFGVAAWPGAARTPVRLDVVLGSRRPADVLLHGGL